MIIYHNGQGQDSKILVKRMIQRGGGLVTMPNQTENIERIVCRVKKKKLSEWRKARELKGCTTNDESKTR